MGPSRAINTWLQHDVSVELARSIIRQEVNSGPLDPHLFQLFLDARIYRLIPPAANPNRPAHG
jgi:hypothetical protein